jgi:hypothetical protein
MAITCPERWLWLKTLIESDRYELSFPRSSDGAYLPLKSRMSEQKYPSQ